MKPRTFSLKWLFVAMAAVGLPAAALFHPNEFWAELFGTGAFLFVLGSTLAALASRRPFALGCAVGAGLYLLLVNGGFSDRVGKYVVTETLSYEFLTRVVEPISTAGGEWSYDQQTAAQCIVEALWAIGIGVASGWVLRRLTARHGNDASA